MNKQHLYLLILVGIAVYANSLFGDFVYDDVSVIVENAYVRDFQVGNILTSVSYWGEDKASQIYRPVTTLIQALLYQLSGGKPLLFHLFNILVHALNILLLYLIVAGLFKSSLPALLSALIFAVHPIHVEAVANVAGGAELFSTAFLLLLFVIHVKHPQFSVKTILLSISLLLCAILAKENTITYVGLYPVAFLFFAEKRSETRPLWKMTALLAGIACLYLIIRFSIYGTLKGIATPKFIDNFLPYQSGPVAFLTAVKVLGLYLAKFIFPLKLSCDYSFPVVTPFAGPADVPLMLLPLMFGASLYFVKDKMYRFGGLFFFITVSIVSNLFIHIGTVMGERLLYLPSAGLCICAVALLQKIRNQKIVTAVTIILMALLSTRTITRNPVWDNHFALWDNVVNNGYPSFRAYSNRASAFSDRKEYDKALTDFKKAIEIYPRDFHTFYNIGTLYDDREMTDSAIVWYTKALDINAYYANARINRGIDYMLHKNYEKARVDFTETLKANPGHFYAHLHLARVLFELKQFGPALESVNRALALDSEHLEAVMLRAKVLLEQGENEAAVGDLHSLLEKGHKKAEVCFYLGYGYLQMDDVENAVKFVKKSISLYPEGREAVKKDTLFRKIWKLID